MTATDHVRPSTNPPALPPPPPPPPPSAAAPTWSSGRTVAVTIGSILALIGVCVLAAGGVLAWAGATQRDRAGYFDTSAERFASNGFAVTTDALDLGHQVQPAGWGIGDLLTVRLRAEAADANERLFIGVARTSDVEAYLDGVAHDVVVDFETDPFTAEYRTVSGERQPLRPQDQGFWIASSAGSGSQEVTWKPGDGTGPW